MNKEKTSEKSCTSCLKVKNLKDFYKKGSRYESICKECKKKKKRTTYVSRRKTDDFDRMMKIFNLMLDSEEAELKRIENEIDQILISTSYKQVS